MNPLLAYSQECPIAKALGVKLESTWWQDFTCADCFGEKGIRDTFNRAWRYWRKDKVYTTELSLVLNWKSWEHYDKGHRELSTLYIELFLKLHSWVLDNWKGEMLRYYLEQTD